MTIEKDGNMYCVKADNFVNLQESNDYFFIDEEEYQKFIFELKNDRKSKLVRCWCGRDVYEGTEHKHV